MAKNKYLNPPPVFINPIDDNKEFSKDWANWFNDLHFLFSNKNNQVITSAKAIELDSEHVDISKSGAGTYAITLAAPTLPCKLKVITMTAVSGGGTVTLDLTNCIGGTAATTCTWDAVTDTLIMISGPTKWVIIKQHGVALT